MTLSSKQRAALRGAANTLDPVFQIGKGEIDETLIDGVAKCLAARELIKCKVLDNSEYAPRAAADILAEARANADIPSVELLVRAGRITDTLEHQLVEPTQPDLVICGERGLSNIKYAFVGSVSTFLIRSMRCDVLVVKQD